MKIHDISMDVAPAMLHYGKRPEVFDVQRISAGDDANVSRWLIGSHTGTHVDAPLHFVDGAAPVEEIALADLVGPTRVVDCSGSDEPIGAAAVAAARLDGATRVLFKTSNSELRLRKHDLDPSYVGIDPDAAQALVDAGVRVVGLDYITVETHANSDGWPSHHILCGAGVTIIEGADLAGVSDGTYFMCCLPVRLIGSEAAPSRAILIEGLTAA
jgi:arylformamidase